MKKRILMGFMVLMITFQTLIIQPYQASAVGVDTVVKLVGGKAVVRALAEKVGMTLSKKQVDNVAGYIEKKTYDGDQKAIEFVQKANSLPSSGASERSGFKKYLLDPLAWLAGIDLIIGAYDAFKDGYETQTPIQSYFTACLPSPFTPPSGALGYSYVKYSVSTGGYYNWVYAWTVQSPTLKPFGTSGVDWTFDFNNSLNPAGSTYRYYLNTAGSWVQSGSPQSNIYDTTVKDVASFSHSWQSDLCEKTPAVDDVPNVSNVSTSVINHFDNDTYNQNTMYSIEIEMPDTVNYDDTIPWNSLDPNIENEVNPDSTAPNEVSNLSETHTENAVNLSWNMPIDLDFAYVRLFRDDVLIADSLAVTSYQDSNLENGGYNTYKITSVDSKGNESQGSLITVDRSDSEPISVKPVDGNWWEWLLKPLKAIGDFIAGLADFLLGLLVPSADSVTGVFNGISDSFKAKIPIADQLGNFFGQIEDIQTNDTPVAPAFEITMPLEYGGGTFPIIDFSYFEEWRVWVLNFIRFAAWYVFLRRLYNRIPKMVY